MDKLQNNTYLWQYHYLNAYVPNVSRFINFGIQSHLNHFTIRPFKLSPARKGIKLVRTQLKEKNQRSNESINMDSQACNF